jgi:hypothetical protein
MLDIYEYKYQKFSKISLKRADIASRGILATVLYCSTMIFGCVRIPSVRYQEKTVKSGSSDSKRQIGGIRITKS